MTKTYLSIESKQFPSTQTCKKMVKENHIWKRISELNTFDCCTYMQTGKVSLLLYFVEVCSFTLLCNSLYSHIAINHNHHLCHLDLSDCR